MPFSEPTPLTINVTQADIDASSSGKTTNSLALAIKRYCENNLLPGQENDTTVQSYGAYAEIQPRIQNGYVVSVYEAFVCTRLYSCDLDTTLKGVLELLGIKPSGPYTVTLVHA